MTSHQRIIDIVWLDFESMVDKDGRPDQFTIARWIRRWYKNHVSAKEVRQALESRAAHEQLRINATRATTYVDGVRGRPSRYSISGVTYA